MSLAMKKITAKSGYDNEPIKDGKYDAVISAIIDLEIQEREFKGEKKASHQVKILFEIPALTKKINDEEVTTLLSMDTTLSANEKSKFYGIVNAALHKSMTPEEMLDQVINSEDGAKSLLGKPVVLSVNTYESKNGGPRNGIKDVLELDPRVLKGLVADGFGPVREPFIFTVGAPDLEIFKTKLSKWTRDKIMTAVNNDEFPPQLHATYRDIKEQEAADNTSGE